MRFPALLAALLIPLGASAASSFQLETPRWISVPGGESAAVAVKFFDAAGRPAAGESVTFSNDACGRFGNGQFSQSTTVDAAGRATATFTASNPPGITCWIRVNAGVVATVDVLTYRVDLVNVQVTPIPAQPRVGQPYMVRVKPMFSAYPLANVDVSARVVAGTGSATIRPEVASTGDAGFADFEVTPANALGGYAIEGAYRSQRKMLTVAAPSHPWQDMWWAGSAEDGWGMSIVQHGDMLFAVIYAYDSAGKPTWFVVPGGTWNEARTEFSGAAYVPTGSPFYAYDPSKFLVGPAVGSVRIAFDGPGRAALDYTLSNKAGHKDLVRHEFGPVDASPLAGVGDMWWGGPAQDGWGIAVLQQYKTLFVVWFTYDATGAPTWYVMPGGSWSASDTYEGRVYRTSSSPWLGVTYDRSRLQTTEVGTYRLRFSGDTASFVYSIEGRSGTIPLSRFPF